MHRYCISKIDGIIHICEVEKIINDRYNIEVTGSACCTSTAFYLIWCPILTKGRQFSTEILERMLRNIMGDVR